MGYFTHENLMKIVRVQWRWADTTAHIYWTTTVIIIIIIITYYYTYDSCKNEKEIEKEKENLSFKNTHTQVILV